MTRDYIDIANEWFEANLPTLLKQYLGKWVCVSGTTLLGAFDTYEDAYREGVKLAKSEEILVRRVIEKKDDKPKEVSVNITLGLLNVASPLGGLS